MLTRGQQATAIKLWVKKGVLVTQVKGVPPTTHFKINILKLLQLIKEQVGLKIDLLDFENQYTQMLKSIAPFRPNNTENTSFVPAKISSDTYATKNFRGKRTGSMSSVGEVIQNNWKRRD